MTIVINTGLLSFIGALHSGRCEQYVQSNPLAYGHKNETSRSHPPPRAKKKKKKKTIKKKHQKLPQSPASDPPHHLILSSYLHIVIDMGNIEPCSI